MDVAANKNDPRSPMNTYAAVRLLPGLALALGLALPVVASAQSAPTPGSVQDTIRRPAVTPPDSNVPSPSTPTQTPPRRPAPGAATVQVSRFFVTGNTLFADIDFRPILSEWENRPLTLADIYNVSDLLTDFYHQRGYRFAAVTVPAQQVDGGVVRLEVIEGKVDRVEFTGDTSYRQEFLQQQVEDLKPGTLLLYETVERELLMLNDLPGLVARSVMQPGADYGTSKIEVNLAETRVEYEAVLDNHGTENIGETRLSGGVTWNNPFGIGDSLRVGLTQSEDSLLTFFSIDYSASLGSRGGRLLAGASLADYEVGGDFEALDLEGSNTSYTLGYRHPVVRSRERNAGVTATWRRVETELEAAGVKLQENTVDLDLLELSGYYQFTHNRATKVLLTSIATTNFKDNGDGDENDAVQLKLDFGLQHEWSFANGWSSFNRAQYVWSDQQLPDTEKFAVGGPFSVRGYAPSEVRGDSGGFASAELRRYFSGGGFNGHVALFGDAGMVDQADPSSVSSTSRTAYGLAVGGEFGGQFTLSGAWAVPADGREVSDGKDDGRFWLSIGARF